MENIFGKKRLPMIIIEKNLILVVQIEMILARLAAINGFSIFAKKDFYF